MIIDEVIAESGTNISIGCPGITQNTFVIQVEWRCTGQCGSKTGSGGDSSLIKFVKGSGVIVRKTESRITLEPDSFSLRFDPVESQDKGKYVCLINNRRLPEAVIQLSVLGK